MVSKFYLHFLLMMCCLSSACQWTQPMGVPPGKTAKAPQTEFQRLAEKAQKKQPLQGPVRLNIDPSWFKPTATPAKDLTQSFQIQKIQEQLPVYDQTFVLTKEDQTFTQDILLSETTARYYFEITKKSKEVMKGALQSLQAIYKTCVFG